MEYKTFKEDGLVQEEIKKSRFLCHVKRVYTEEEARDFIAAIKKEHYKATHNCSAFVIGEQFEIKRTSDDGEPSGTAGVPMLGVLENHELTNICCVVTRYFGGIKLGVSGLITAYKTTAQLTLQEAEIEERTIDLTYKIVFDYKDMNKVIKIIKDRNLTIVSQTMEMNCTLLVEVRKAEASYVEQLFQQLYEVTIEKLED